MRRFGWLAMGFLAAPLLASASELTCAPGPLLLASALPSCSYGPPVISGESILIPKVCLHDSGGGKVLRHSVEARSLATGARQNQAALPAQATTTEALPAAGTLLPGTQALLVVPQGIAACDFQRGSAELVFESQGSLLGAARSGDVLMLVEALPGEGKAKPPRLEWTVLDLESEKLLGQVLMAGTTIEGLALQRSGAALTAVLWQVIGGRRQQVSAAVLSASGQLLAKDGDLALRLEAAPEPTAAPGFWPQTAFCPVAVAERGALAGRPAWVVGAGGQPQQRRSAVDPLQVRRLAWRTPQVCLGAALAAGATRGAAWLQTASGGAELRTIVCSEVAASAPN